MRHLPGHKLDKIPFRTAEEQKYVSVIQLAEFEQRDWLFLSIPGLVIILTSTVFGIVWAILKNDAQIGFTIAMFTVTAGIALLVSIHVCLEYLQRYETIIGWLLHCSNITILEIAVTGATICKCGGGT